MESSELIKSFGEHLGVELALDTDGACAIDVDGLAVTINDLTEINSIALTGDLGEPPPENLEALYKALLEANHLFNGTAGATLSLDASTGHFALCRVMPCMTLDVDTFVSEVEHFVNVLETWTKIIVNFREASPQGEELLDSFSPNSFMQV